MQKTLIRTPKTRSSVESFKEKQNNTMTLEERYMEIDKLEIMLFKLFCPGHKHPKELIMPI